MPKPTQSPIPDDAFSQIGPGGIKNLPNSLLNADVLESNGFIYDPDPDNGHYYKFVTDQVTFQDAQAGAAAQGGYLATVTSAEENQFLFDLMDGSGNAGVGGWLGGSDARSEGVWKWINGPEKGEQFWQGDYYTGSTVGGAYENWADNEPNDYQTGEDYLHMDTNGQWNDWGAPNAPTLALGYFVEIGV